MTFEELVAVWFPQASRVFKQAGSVQTRGIASAINGGTG